MHSAYVELEYRRPQDNMLVALVTGVPSVRTIAIGGAPSDLRLPGTDPDVVFAHVSPESDGFHLRAERREPPIYIDGEPLGEAAHALQDGDILTIDRFQLTFHEGEPPTDAQLLETPLRWKRSSQPFDDVLSGEPFDPAAKPHIEEFELSVRPLVHTERYADVQAHAEGEMRRLLKSPDFDALDAYNEFLWWMRVRMARESDSDQSAAIAKQAFDLFPESVILMVACGTTFMVERDWARAAEAFERALRHARLPWLASVHDARLGGVLVEHLKAIGEEALRAEPAQNAAKLPAWDAAPLIALHTPGDEVLIWRMAWYGRVFGARSDVRFGFVGGDPATTDKFEMQRWEIHNREAGTVVRRRVAFPAVPYADPSLIIETGAIRNAIGQSSGDFSRVVVDISDRAEAEPQFPVEFSETLLRLLPKQVQEEVTCARLSHAQGRLRLEMLSQPHADDIVYAQGAIRAAVANDLAGRVQGGILTPSREHGLLLRMPDGDHFRVEFLIGQATIPRKVRLALRPQPRGRRARPWLIGLAILVTMSAIVGIVMDRIG